MHKGSLSVSVIYWYPREQDITLSTYALGSCIGVIAYDTERKAGGILHYMLPDSSLSPDKANSTPAMFADTGMDEFLNQLKKLGMSRKTTKFLIAGGASVLKQKDLFKIGDRNIEAIRKIILKRKIHLVHERVGGLVNRTVHLQLLSGKVEIKEPDGSTYYTL